MSTKYPGGIITKNYVAPTPSSASGIWTLDQQQQAQQAGIWPFGGPFIYIEDVFSTYLYTGTSAARTITNDIDLSGKGGLVWIKARSAATNHRLFDTARGATKYLASNQTSASTTDATSLTAFNSSGFSLGDDSASGDTVNGTGVTYASWTFREQPKFFDIVTYTGDGTQGRTIAHSLGSVPACIIVKCTSNATAWRVYHTSLGNTQGLRLDSTAVPATSLYYWNNTTPTSTVFTVGDDETVNQNGYTYVAYLFASNAGGFGLTGTDNVISCGGFTADGSGNATVNLGYEPQWILVKRTSSATNWHIYDTMRGWTVNSSGVGQQVLYPDLTTAEQTGYPYSVNSTGFGLTGVGASNTFIYIAIRRGPMKVPTTGTSVFSPNYQNVSTGTAITTNFPPDLQLYRSTAQVANEGVAVDRLRGVNTTTTANSTPWLDTTTTAAEASASSVTRSWGNTGFQMPGFVATVPSVFYSFRRAPGFFDEVCYTGTGANRTITHNLAAAPELWIVKLRGGAAAWAVGSTALANTEYLLLNTTDAKATGATYWNSTYPTATTLSLGTQARVNDVGTTVVAWLFATCAGVSKVGSYTGTGTTQTINCGFTAGSRFVLIKRTDSTSDWYVWDTARGIVSGNDPYLLLNSTAAEVTGTDYVDTTATGFEISSTAPAAINANGGTYIFLAIA